MQGSDFSNVRVGDKIWTTESGDCMVEKVDDSDSTFCADGNWFKKEGGSPVGTKALAAFWSKPNIEIPPPPKRMVKSKIHFWHVYSTNGRLIHCFDEPTDVKGFTETEESANCFIKHYIDEIEVEE